MFPQSTGRTPIPRTKRWRFAITPGWSPSALVKITPARSAYVFRIGPIVPSSSAFMRTTCLRCSIADTATDAASSTVPVTSITASTGPASVTTRGSSVIAYRPAAMATSTSSAPASSYASRARSRVRFAIATSRRPGTEPRICSAIPRPMKPAPTMPTRSGLPSARRCSSARSTTITPRLPGEVGPVAVLLGQERVVGLGPLDRERRVVPAHAALGAGRVVLGHLVEDLGIRGERLVAVREAFRYEQRAPVVGGELDSQPLLVGLRVATQVDDDVVDRAARAANELRLGVGGTLEVHAAQRPLPRVERDVRLHDLIGEAVVGELVRAPRAREEPTRVLAPFEVDEEGSRESRLLEDHAASRQRSVESSSPRSSSSRRRFSRMKRSLSNWARSRFAAR